MRPLLNDILIALTSSYNEIIVENSAKLSTTEFFIIAFNNRLDINTIDNITSFKMNIKKTNSPL